MGDLDNKKLTLDLVLNIKDEKSTTRLLILSLIIVSVINILTIWILIKGQ